MRRFNTKNKTEKEWAWEMLDKTKSSNINPNLKHKLKLAARAESLEVERIRGKRRQLENEQRIEQNKIFAKLIDPELEQYLREM